MVMNGSLVMMNGPAVFLRRPQKAFVGMNSLMGHHLQIGVFTVLDCVGFHWDIDPMIAHEIPICFSSQDLVTPTFKIPS